jgi:hypothetical protein
MKNHIVSFYVVFTGPAPKELKRTFKIETWVELLLQ